METDRSSTLARKKTVGVSRRTVIKGTAWSIPVVALAATAPAAASSTPGVYAITSSFGSGWYPDLVQGQTTDGAFQFDASVSSPDNQYFTVTGTTAGDEVSGIFFQVLVSDGWPPIGFTALAGSNPSWSTLADTGTTVTIDGITRQVYQSNYSGTVTATGSTTDIPIEFYFRSDGPYYAGQTLITRRFATVNATLVSYIGPVSDIDNTNQLLSTAPTP